MPKPTILLKNCTIHINVPLPQAPPAIVDHNPVETIRVNGLGAMAKALQELQPGLMRHIRDRVERLAQEAYDQQHAELPPGPSPPSSSFSHPHPRRRRNVRGQRDPPSPTPALSAASR